MVVKDTVENIIQIAIKFTVSTKYHVSGVNTRELLATDRVI